MEEQEVITELVEPQTVPAPMAEESTEKPKRVRKSRAKSAASEAMAAFEDADGPALAQPKAATRTRRGAKLTGDDVAGAIELASGLYAMFTGQQHWAIPAAEIKSWSGEAAALLNKIPAKYVRAATDASGYATVAIGIYSTAKPRIDYSAALKRERAEQQAIERAKSMESTQVDGVEVPWGGTV